MTTTIEPIRRLARRWGLWAVMVLTIAAVFGVASSWMSRERKDMLDEFSYEQAVLAQAVAIDFEQRLAAKLAENDGRTDAVMFDEAVRSLLAGAHRLEHAHELMVLVSRPGQGGFLTTDRRLIPSSRVHAALERGDATVQVPRDEAATFGLPRRLAIAGLARVGSTNETSWGVVVLASAQRIRDRERHGWWRLGATTFIVTAVVAAFGAIAQRRQRTELELQRQIAISSLEREREALLAKADKMAALAALGTGIAHEVGTPLGVIVGRVDQVMPRVEKDERAKTALGIVLEQVARIQAIVRGCLALARGDAPHLDKAPPTVLAERAAALVAHRFDHAEVILDVETAEGLPLVACEPSLFEQALVNVLLNACHATARGGRVVLRVEESDDKVVFVVDDEGEGISDEVAKRATEPFFSTRRDEGGSGLGLTIAREIVSHHQGTFSLAKRVGTRGTRATIALARI